MKSEKQGTANGGEGKWRREVGNAGELRRGCMEEA